MPQTHLIDRVAAKLHAGERLSDADALALFESPELIEIGKLADQVNRDKNHDVVFFNVNRHINPTNICALSCKFCAYSRKPGEEGAYAYSIDEMVQKAGEAVAQGATEVHMVGGLHPRWKYDHYRDMIKAVKDAFPQVHIKAFTAVELDWLARKARKTVREILIELREVGLGSLPGGGAEIFDPEVRDAICETKVSAEQWIETHTTAHALGMHSNATMLYGHIERYHHRVDHMRRLREAQDRSKGFNAFIPLSFQPFQNEMGIDKYTFGYDDLKTHAIARLYLDNYRHIKAYWIMLGQDVAQLALSFGANDLDGTVIEEKISRMAGGRAGMAMERPFIEAMVAKAHRQPCERDTLYHPIGAHAGKVPAAPAAVAPALLNRAHYHEALSVEELVQLAGTASLHELGRLALATPERQGRATEASYVPTIVLPWRSEASVGDIVASVSQQLEASRERHTLIPQVIALDLADHAPDMGMLVELTFALSHAFPACELNVRGFRALWRLAQAQDVEPSELFAALKEAGVAALESSPRETERDMTAAEIAELHRAAHASDLATVAKVELDAPEGLAGEPFWERFVRRVVAFSALAGETRGLNGLSVEVVPGSFVTASEYMRAVAVARIAATGVPLIIAPLAEIPTISPARGLGTASSQHPAEKIAALALHFGASDLGPIDVARLSVVDVARQIRSAGFEPLLRDAQATTQALDVGVQGLLGNIRHVPAVSAPVLS
jgi:aminodeoxyfutalosine synthase